MYFGFSQMFMFQMNDRWISCPHSLQRENLEWQFHAHNSTSSEGFPLWACVYLVHNHSVIGEWWNSTKWQGMDGVRSSKEGMLRWGKGQRGFHSISLPQSLRNVQTLHPMIDINVWSKNFWYSFRDWVHCVFGFQRKLLAQGLLSDWMLNQNEK
jgi:hypothetical protein